MIENKVAKSKLNTIDLEQFRERRGIVAFDLKDYLHMEFILKEKDFRAALEEHDWQAYEGKIIAVHCSTDAIIAHWAYMLVCAHAQEFAERVVFGTPEEVALQRMQQHTRDFDWSAYDGKRVLLKGCSDQAMHPSIYSIATQELIPYAERLMYGEACSFVPVYRKKKAKKPEPASAES